MGLQTSEYRRQYVKFLFTLTAFAFGVYFGHTIIVSSVDPNSLELPRCPKTNTPPKTVYEARQNLAQSLMQVWELDKDEEAFKQGGKSAPRSMLDLFISEVANSEVGRSLGPRCIDWSASYISRFPGCEKNYNYEYSMTPKFREATNDTIGLVEGDLGESMVHVPTELLDFAIVTQVFEHIPYFWKAMPNLARLVSPGGVVLFTVPFSYQYHLVPGDFYRYSPMAIIHMFESNGFAVCHFASDGLRALQMQALALNLEDIENQNEYLSETQSKWSLTVGASNYYMVAQKLLPGSDVCTLGHIDKITNELTKKDVIGKGGFWPLKVSGQEAFSGSSTVKG
ncbi:hypothetical protein SARC_11640 [Sphaeroforma arctica JP610]|uniref:Methyltransferase type 11 domain-containing protein n=1 Tax=Sphaeroforma arctica JP610 TaxID=667725 RepID=A0A0L0FH87_9EUKA|nr:hypothetical protein SARC_11640 [Sphaeroforma arctica JP610]KNC75841.1 hypothetical protein SARC_11640 [Sphaeroforma arctica JP610]|eukprot:XP_014149743.1 hypothetical protein SARC_11640 [Sphaeroforma arctica JP610]